MSRHAICAEMNRRYCHRLASLTKDRLPPRRVPLRILALLVLTLQMPSALAVAADRTTVALTTSVPAGANKAQQDLADSLLALLELKVSQRPAVTVVERMRIDLVLNELVINRGLAADDRARLQLGRLTTAELILTAELRQPDAETKAQLVLVRVVEALTGSIRGVTVAAIDEVRIEEAASQIARYLSAVIEAPKQAGVTVAVGAFESGGRFDRLRPLELGIRDMITQRMLHFGHFQVLQRSSMKQLVEELELIRSGLADQSQLPETLPTRAAAYLLHGTINERNVGNQLSVIVRGKLVHAGSGKTVHDFQFEAIPNQFAIALAARVDQIRSHLAKASQIPPGELAPRPAFDETEFLFDRAVTDLYRFRRISPVDFSYRRFRLPGKKPPSPPQAPVIYARSALGRHLLRKSIDRLESVLFIQPDRTEAAYALGFCYSYHLDGIRQPERGSGLLRSAFDRDPQGELGARALRIYSEMSFHHRQGRVAEPYRQAAAEQMLFAFEQIPAERRTRRWSRIPAVINRLCGQQKDVETAARTMRIAAAVAEQADRTHRYNLAMGVSSLAASLSGHGGRFPELQREAHALLMRWAEGKKTPLSHVASRGLATIATQKKDFAAAARWYLRAADSCEPSRDPSDKYAKENLLIHAARSLRTANRPEEALQLLQSIDPTWAPTSLNRGSHGVEIGACYEALGQKKEALQSYVAAAEQAPHLVDNSNVANRIKRLGGVPIRKDRDLEVRYIPGPDDRPFFCRVLATDGRRLYCGGGFRGKYAKGVMARDLGGESWQAMGEHLDRVTCLAVDEGLLWVGTDGNGLWRHDLGTNNWTQWVADCCGPSPSGERCGLGR